MVCEGFVTLAESVCFQVEAVNASKIAESPGEKRGLKNNNWLYGESGSRNSAIETLFKSIWLLVQSQKGIPLRWSRFNEKRLREIAFSFINMLSSSKNLKVCIGRRFTSVIRDCNRSQRRYIAEWRQDLRAGNTFGTGPESNLVQQLVPRSNRKIAPLFGAKSAQKAIRGNSGFSPALDEEKGTRLVDGRQILLKFQN